MKKQKADLVGGIIVALVGLFFLIQTAINPQMSFVSTTSDGVPGGGFFPYILSVLLLAGGIALIIRGAVKGNKKYFEMNDEMRSNVKLMLLTFALIVVLLIAWKVLAPIVGGNVFYICIAIFEVILNKFAFKRTWLFSILYAVIFSVFIYFVFGVFFSIQFNA